MRIAFYGKGGIGKSTIAANVSASLAEAGKKVLHIGCDPKADSTRSLCHGKIPTVLSQINRLGDRITRDDIVFEGAFGICCIEAGGPQAGVGCAGMGITIMEQTLNQLHILDEGWDVIIYDVLGDVVCGGFSVPVRMHYVDLVYIVSSSDYMALYAANNIIKGIAAFSDKQNPMFGGLIGNHCSSNWDRNTVEAFAEKIQGNVIRWMPESSLIKQADFQKKTVLEAYPESSEAEEFRLLAKTMYAHKQGTLPVPLREEALEEVGLEERSMNETACPIETAAFRKGSDMIRSLPAKILEKEGIALLVPGSLACTKAVDQVAKTLDRKEYFFPLFITPGQYADGSSGRLIREALEKILEFSSVQGIIIYASCLEVMFRTDFNAIISSLRNPQDKKVAVLYRGPLVKRNGSPAARLHELIKQMQQAADRSDKPDTFDKSDISGRSDTSRQSARSPLPAAYPDFHGILSTFQQLNVYLFLITPGGCVNGMTEICESKNFYQLKQSRFNDVQLAMGMESSIINGICQDFSKSMHSFAFLTSSAVPTAVGMDVRQISTQLRLKGIPNLYLPSDGFTPAQIGISRAFLEVGKRFVIPPKKHSNQVNILGFSPAVFGPADKITDGLSYLKKEGYTWYLWGTGEIRDIGESAQAALNWVISSEGLALAEWMKKRWNIPYITGIPIGKMEVRHWLNELRRKTENMQSVNDDGMDAELKTEAPCKNILIIAEPVLARSIQTFLQTKWPDLQTVIAVYTPVNALWVWYQQLYPDQDYCCFSSIDQLQLLVDPADAIIADPIYRESLSGNLQTRPWLSLPDPIVSGNAGKQTFYKIFGEKGAVYLEKGLKL